MAKSRTVAERIAESRIAESRTEYESRTVTKLARDGRKVLKWQLKTAVAGSKQGFGSNWIVLYGEIWKQN